MDLIQCQSDWQTRDSSNNVAKKMPKTNGICITCLRTDIKLKVVDIRLSNFHDELCNYSCLLGSLNNIDAQYCTECEYLLRKLYKFKEMCVLAVNILDQWKKKETEKPQNLLYTLLPQSTLGFWKPNNPSVHVHTQKTAPDISTITSETVSNLNTPGLAPVLNMQYSGLKPLQHSGIVLWTNIPRPVLLNDKQKSESNNLSGSVLNTNVPRPILVLNDKVKSESNIKSGSALNTNAPKPVLVLNDKLRPGSNSNVRVSYLGPVSNENKLNLGPGTSLDNILSSHPQHKLDMKKIIIIDNNQHLDNYIKKEPIEDGIPIHNNIRRKINCDNDRQVSNLDNQIKTEDDPMDIFDEVLLQNYSDEEKDNQLMKMENQDDNSLNGDDNIKSSNIRDRSSINSDDIRDVDEVKEEASIDSDNNVDKVTKNESRSIRNNKSLNKLADISFSDDDGDTELKSVKKLDIIDSDDESNTEIQELETTNKLVAFLENINNDIRLINADYEKSLPDNGNIVEKRKRKYCRRKQTVDKQLEIICEDMNTMQGYCENIINGKSTSADALVTRLRKIFESCGELKSLVKGVPMDKEYILNIIFDGKVPENQIKSLAKALMGNENLNRRALQILSWIDNVPKTDEYESVFNIEYFNSTQKMVEEFQKRKTYECYVTANHKCELCYAVFLNGTLLKNHIMKIHAESPSSIVCSICGVRYGDRTKFTAHMNGHRTVYKCKLCPMVTHYRGSMIQHYNQHMGTEYKCVPCNKTFGSSSSYSTHRAYRHRRAHVCTTCGRTFDTEEILNTHKKAHRNKLNTDSASVKCDKCDLEFPSQQVYNRHARFTHGVFESRRSKKNGEENKEGEKKRLPKIKIGRKPNSQFTCPLCKAFGDSYGWLEAHGRSEHDVDVSAWYSDKWTYLCDYCGKVFVNKHTLREHVNSHTDSRPHACDICPKRFNAAISLHNHRTYHFPPKKMCTECGKMYHSSCNLFLHMRTHVRDRRFKCDICGKGFLHNAALREHVRGVHFNERRVRKRRVTAPRVRGVTEPGVSGVTTPGVSGVTEPGVSGVTKSGAARTSAVIRKRPKTLKVVATKEESSESD